MKPARITVLLALLLCLPSAWAEYRLGLNGTLQQLGGAGWEARQIQWTWTQREPDSGAVTLRIGELQLPAPIPVLSDLELQCGEFALLADTIRCEQGQLHSAVGKAQLRFVYRTKDQALELNIAGLKLAGGRLAVTAQGTVDDWRLVVNGEGLALTQLAAMARRFGFVALEQNQGQVAGQVVVYGNAALPARIEAQLDTRNAAFSMQNGNYAASALNSEIAADWRLANGGFRLKLTIAGGELYLNPLYWQVTTGQAALSATVEGRRNGSDWRLERIALHHPGILQASGSLRLRTDRVPALQSLNLQLAQAQLPAAFETYVKPFFFGSMLGDLQTRGDIQGELQLSDAGVTALEFNLHEVGLEDARQRFGLQGLNGRLAWDTQADAAQVSALSWRGGHAYSLPLGGGDLAMEAQGRSFRFLGQRRIPVLDGAVVIDRLEGDGLAAEDFNWRFAGQLLPVSMERLSEALGWPSLSGTLAGTVPDVRYANRTITVNGDLQVNVFDGLITIAGLRVSDPLGNAPRLTADLSIQALDLKTLTRTFDFGRIEGKLAGRVDDLVLDDWQPVSFDAVLATPKDNPGRRRISQRAVENISSLGGSGAAGALSRGFLGFFDEFSYSRLGIRCRLQNGICEMSGVAPAANGYYLVEGGGLPRIDVIGYNQQVDWQDLLARLQAAARSQGPEIR